MDIKDLITYLDLQLMELEDSEEDTSAKSWGMQNGILLSGNEVKTIINNYRALATKQPTENANCAIFDFMKSWRFCPNCAIKWENDSNSFGCWNCGYGS